MKLIDKDTLVAEIESYINDTKFSQKAGMIKKRNAETKITIFKSVLSLIDTLEVKEADLDEVARKWEDKVYLEKGWQNEYGTPHAPFSEIGNAFREGAKFILKVQKGE